MSPATSPAPQREPAQHPDGGPAGVGPARVGPVHAAAAGGVVRVAAVDCGTNSIRLLVADVVPATAGRPARLVDVDRRMEVVRLGQDVDRTGRFAPEALERTLAATARCAAVVRELGAVRVRFVATSATRDAANAHELVDGVRALLGVAPEVITGDEEARLSFRGAAGWLEGAGPALVVDLGGGSTELALGGARGAGRGDGDDDGDGDAADGGGGDGAAVAAAHSMDVGCVRLTERHLAADPPAAEAVEAARRDVRAALDAAAADVPLERATALVGVAGTVTTITAHALRLDRYDPERIHGAELSVEQVLTAAQELIDMPRAQRAALPYMHPGRVDAIGAGAVVWQEVVRRVAAASGVDRVLTSEHDILDGIALGLADAAPGATPGTAPGATPAGGPTG